jgi:hypothetical protein
MISLKDIPMLVGLGASVVTGSFYVHDIKRDVAELSSDYRQHVVSGQRTDLLKEKYILEDRLKKTPEDMDTRNRLKEVEDELEVNKETQKQLKGNVR